MAFSREAQTSYTDDGSSTGAVVWYCGASAAHSQLSLLQPGKGHGYPRTHPAPGADPADKQPGKAKSSKSNLVWASFHPLRRRLMLPRSPTHARQRKEGTARTGTKVLLRTAPDFRPFPAKPSRAEYDWAMQRCSCSSAGLRWHGPFPSPARQRLQTSLQWQRGPASDSWDVKQKEALRPQFRAA